MDSYVVWFIAAFMLVAAEILSGTFYLLVVGIGVGAGGAAAWFGAPLATQFVVASAVGLLGVVLLNRWKATQRAVQPAEQSLDAGASVQVESWNQDGTARVQYRGSLWDARLESPDVPRASVLFIKSTDGSTLILTNRKP